MPRWLQITFGLGIAALIVGGPLAYARQRHNTIRNFHVVREGVLYRSGQDSLAGLARLIHDYRIKTVVTLRYPQRPGEPAPDAAEEDFCKKSEITYFRLPQKPWEAPDGSVPNEESVSRFRDIMN